jgi:hypothetical protein
MMASRHCLRVLHGHARFDHPIEPKTLGNMRELGVAVDDHSTRNAKTDEIITAAAAES